MSEEFEFPEKREEDEMASDGSEDNDGASAPGVAFAYETAKWQLEKQEQSLREVNSRLAFLLAGLLGFSTYFFKELDPIRDPGATVIFGIALALPVILAGIGYLPRGYTRPPHPLAVARFANSAPGAVKEKALGTMLSGFATNKQVIDRKALFFFLALLVALAELVLGIGYKTLQGSAEIAQEWRQAHEQRGTGSKAGCTTHAKGRAATLPTGATGPSVHARRNC